ncbi:hypothetical protein T4B_2040 [Trichinella pseudospiralis]|uniref:Uncharacterized protein n=1 Tax=Trichinella pseudospiralis TaxID=6337 RepID=A0A0V1F0D9_TRIPS|nr:hypothetical protein T4A_9214 [Trichinella pseudospiralis]KRZ20705.1 hypothetical protein T4B_2040 [Trichinella pseudospiralis]
MISVCQILHTCHFFTWYVDRTAVKSRYNITEQRRVEHYCCKFSLQSDRQVCPAMFDMAGDSKVKMADLAEAS